MRSLLIALLVLGVPALHASTPKPCADTGESSSSRKITPSFGTALKLTDVPSAMRQRAVSAWTLSNIPRNQRPPDGLSVTAARRFRFGQKTFYLLMVRDEMSIFSTACPREWCTEFTWWPSTATIVADAARPPQVVPGDEWYLVTTDGPILVATDAFSEGYVWEEDCSLRVLTDAATGQAVRPPITTAAPNVPAPSPLPSHMETVCAPSETVACFEAHSVRVTDSAGRLVPVIARDSRTASFSHGPVSAVVLAVTATCATGNVLRARITSTNEYQVIVRNIHTNKTYQYTATSEGATGATVPCD